MGRKFGRASSARVDREGIFELQGCLAEAWLVKEAAAILLASWIPDGRSPLRSVNLHTWLYALSHKSTTCVIRIQSIQTSKVPVKMGYLALTFANREKVIARHEGKNRDHH